MRAHGGRYQVRLQLYLKRSPERLHAQIEEEIFYPAPRKALPDAGALLDKAMAEHQQAKELIAEQALEAG